MSRSNRSHAVRLAIKGYRVTPLNGKRPFTDNWGEVATSDPGLVGAVWTDHPEANIGVVTGGSLVVLDMDPRNGGEASLRKLEKEIGPLPEPTVRTGGGGCHWYFRTQRPIESGKLAPGLDIKGVGGQVVAPPSVHPVTGKSYEFVNGSLPHPLPLPLQAYFQKAKAPKETTSRMVSDFISQGTRNDDLTSMAGWMRGRGANQHQIETALIALAKESGLDVREAKRTAASIAQKPSGTEEAISKLVYGLDLREAAHRRRRQRDATYVELPEETLRDALKRPRNPTRFTVQGLHPQGGNTLFLAQRKAGKTTVSMNLVKCLSDRTSFLGEFDVSPVKGRVAYLNYELNEDQCLQWFADLSIKNRSRISVLNLRGKPGCLWHDTNLPKFINWLQAHHISTLVIDPAGRAWRGVVEDENSNSQVREYTSILDEVKHLSGVSDLVLVHHIGKSHTDEGSERGRGASALEDWPDAIWTLTKDPDGTRSFGAEGRDVELSAHDLDYDHSSRSLTMTGSRSVRRAETKKLIKVIDEVSKTTQLLSTLSQLEKPTSKQAIKTFIGWGNATNQAVINSALQAKLIEQSPGPRNSWLLSLTELGREQLSLSLTDSGHTQAET